MRRAIKGIAAGMICLLSGVGAAMAANLEEMGAIDRYDVAAKMITINGKVYRVVDPAAALLAGYLDVNGVGSLGGKVAMFHSDGHDGSSPFIDIIEVIDEQSDREGASPN